MTYDLEGKVFKSVANSASGQVGEDTLFFYHQEGDMVWAEYRGGAIRSGHLMAKVGERGVLEMSYHHMNRDGDLMYGRCRSTPEVMPDGKIKFHEEWRWLSGDESSGTSKIVEV